MVVNEAGLCAAMKRAYKESGYKIAAVTADGPTKMMIAATGWCVLIHKSQIPRKVLALIVEHVGDIPREGEAYQVQKKQVQTEIHGVTTKILENLRDPGSERRQVKHTGLCWGRYILWQRLDDLAIVKVDPDTESIMGRSPQTDMLGDSIVTTSGLVSDVYIVIVKTSHEEQTRMEHLSNIQWV